MEVIWKARALRHLDEIIVYIGERNPGAAIALRDRIIAATSRLGMQPQLGRHGRIEGTRELVIPGARYIIPYRVRYGRVEILAVIHAARQWPEKL